MRGSWNRVWLASSSRARRLSDDPPPDDPDRHDRRWSGSSSGRHPPCCGGVPPLPLTRIAAAAAPAMISTAKILRSSRIGRLYPVPADGTRAGGLRFSEMARVTRGIGAGIACLTFVSTICVSPLGVPPAAALGASVDCTEHTGTPGDHPALASYTPITPVRLVDTRDGTGGVAEPVGAGCTLIDRSCRLAGSGRCRRSRPLGHRRGTAARLPDGVRVRGRPAGDVEPQHAGGVPTPNLVVSAVGTQRRVCVFANAATDVIVDLAGWWSDGPDRFASITPVRAYDTRELPDAARLPAGRSAASRSPASTCRATLAQRW